MIKNKCVYLSIKQKEVSGRNWTDRRTAGFCCFIEDWIEKKDCLTCKRYEDKEEAELLKTIRNARNAAESKLHDEFLEIAKRATKRLAKED